MSINYSDHSKVEHMRLEEQQNGNNHYDIVVALITIETYGDSNSKQFMMFRFSIFVIDEQLVMMCFAGYHFIVTRFGDLPF